MITREKRPRNVRWIIVYVLLAITLLGPALSLGFVLTLDMVFTPDITLPSSTSPSFLFYVLLKVFSFALPVWLLQKLLLIGIFVLAGMGANKFMQAVFADKKQKLYGAWPYYFAGIFFAVNPFTYTRLMAGQSAVLLGYALLPLVALFTLKFLRDRSTKNAVKLTGLLLAVSIVSIHTLGLACIVMLCLLAAALLHRRPSKNQLLRGAKLAAVGLVAFCALSFYWLVPLATGSSTISQTVGGFSSQDADAFATSPGDIGLTLNVLALQGFWGDEKNLYLLPQDNYTTWLVPIFLLWVLVALGVCYGLRQKRTASIAMLGIGFIGFALAVGTSGTLFAPINNWLFEHIPFFAGYREPQKFAALIALAYAYFGAFGVAFIAQALKNKVLPKNILLGLCLLLPFACSPLMLFGANNQLKATDYPKDWYQINEYLNQTDPQGTTVFLPWRLYMPYPFTERVIANPASKFFDSTMLTSKNPGLGSAASYSTDAATNHINDVIMPRAKSNQDLAKDLRELGVDHILLAKTLDYKDYAYLNNKPGISIERQTQNLVLYRVEEP